MKMPKAKRRTDRMETILFVFTGAVLLLTVILCLTVYLFCMRFMTDQTIGMQSTLTANGFSEIRDTLRNLDTYFVQTLGRDENAGAFFSAKKDPSNQRTIAIRDLLRSFPYFRDSRGIVSNTEDIWIYGRNNGCILNNVTSFTTLEEFAAYLELEPVETVTAQARDYQDNFAFFPIRIASEDQILFVHKTYSKFSCTGKAFCILNARRILNILKGFTLPDLPSEAVLYTESSGVVYSTLDRAVSESIISRGVPSAGSDTVDLSGENYVAFQTGLSDYGLSLLFLIPRSYFHGYAIHNSMMVLKYMLPLVALGFLLLLILLLYNHRFLSDILHIFEPSRKDATTINPYKYLRQSVSQLNRTKEEQRFLLENSYNEMREATLTSIVYRPSERVVNLHEKLSEYGIDLDSDRYSGLILSLFTEEGSIMQVTDREHMCILDIISELAPEIRYIKMDGPYHMLLLSGLDDAADSGRILSEQLHHICSAIAQTIHCRVFICAGREVRKIENLSWSFKTARDMLPSMQANGTPVCLCQSSSGSRKIYSYTDQDSLELSEAASLSDPETVKRKLDSILEKNDQLIRTPFERQLLYAHMISTLINAGYTGEFDEDILLHLPEIPPENFFGKMAGYYEALCRANAANREKHQEQMTEAILAHVRDHLSDYEYTLSDLSADFGISERQMQQRITARTGMSFAAWLEHCRIEKAIRLLQDPDLKISEIAELTGYASDKSFRRAFKRVTGNPPSQKRNV